MPEINVPTGVANNNVPTGLQIASRPYDESTCAAIAFAYADQMAPLPFHLLVFHNSE
jgi:Asp-tRNA(Asn)/Glu-tRNA(Gln) amidotransferase A subunit family amidase